MKKNKIPWNLPADQVNFFHLITRTQNQKKQNAVLMDLSVWELLPQKVKPLGNCINVIISSNSDLDFPDGVLQFENLEQALIALDTSEKIENIFLIGGEKLFQEAILSENLEKIFITRIEEDFNCDQFFPDNIPEDFEIISASEIMNDNGLEFSFIVLGRGVDHSEDEFFEFDDNE